ncbi:MAG: hypothetical protein ISS69_02570 [Phycisphaerae bacterium]|nr:hypothetical protein [Phycisphaerae bacterium]
MVASETSLITCDYDYLSYEGACEIAREAATLSGIGSVRINLLRVVGTTTPALARLIVLRRSLSNSGRDMQIDGLAGQAEDLYEFNRMETFLPRYRRGGNRQAQTL